MSPEPNQGGFFKKKDPAPADLRESWREGDSVADEDGCPASVGGVRCSREDGHEGAHAIEFTDDQAEVEDAPRGAEHADQDDDCPSEDCVLEDGHDGDHVTDESQVEPPADEELREVEDALAQLETALDHRPGRFARMLGSDPLAQARGVADAARDALAKARQVATRRREQLQAEREALRKRREGLTSRISELEAERVATIERADQAKAAEQEYQIARVEADTQLGHAKEYQRRAAEQLASVGETRQLRDESMSRLNTLRSQIVGLARSLGCPGLVTADEQGALTWLLTNATTAKKLSGGAPQHTADKLARLAVLAELEERTTAHRIASHDEIAAAFEEVCVAWRTALGV